MRAILIAAAAVLAGGAIAADVTFRLQFTIPEAQMPEFRRMLDSDSGTFPPIYSNKLTVVAITNHLQQVTVTTNTEQVVVAESDRQKTSRISSDVVAHWWRRQLQAYRNRTMPSVAPTPVNIVVQ